MHQLHSTDLRRFTWPHSSGAAGAPKLGTQLFFLGQLVRTQEAPIPAPHWIAL